MLFPPRVAIVGAPNVGKSTLANQLFARERSITANLPGTTRDWVGALANLDGLPVMLVDTPGLRQTDDPIERAAIHRSASVIRRAELVIEVIDASAPIPPTWPGALVVMNKNDRSIGYGVPGALRIVAITGEGVDAVRDAVRSQFDFARLDLDRPMVWTDRHRSILERAREAPAVLWKIIE